MSIDKGSSDFTRLMEAGYVKTCPQGVLFTKEGINWLSNQLQELYSFHSNAVASRQSSKPSSIDKPKGE